MFIIYMNQLINYINLIFLNISKKTLLVKDIYSLIPSELNNSNKRFILKKFKSKVWIWTCEYKFKWRWNWVDIIKRNRKRIN